MATRRFARIVRATLALMFFATLLEIAVATEAEARAGGGRSFGRSSGFSARRSAPPPRSMDSAPNLSQPGMGQSPMGGGFMRNLAGGIAGGFLGSMLFSSLGHAFGGSGMGGAAHGGGGIGLLEILLFAGLAYFGFRWWKSRQQAEAFAGYGSTGGGVVRPLQRGAEWGNDRLLAPQPVAALGSTTPESIDSDEASDCFFKIQGAWTRRDLSSVRDLLGAEVARTLDEDLQALKRDQRINRLENIAVRNVDVGEPWQEDGADFVTVRFTANLLDYIVDERSGDVVGGSSTAPVKFAEDWTFRRAPGSRRWILAGIAQI